MKVFDVLTTIKLLCLFTVAVHLYGCCGSGGTINQPAPSGSQAGSTATMLTHKNTLYVLDKGELKVFDISATNNMSLSTKQWFTGAETLFIYGEHLYIGGRRGVDILDISQPNEPKYVSLYFHQRACDPVIVDNDIGYVTLRNRVGCRGTVGDRLEIVDFSDPVKPQKLNEFFLSNPYGLAKTPEFLAICREHQGLSLLDVSDYGNISVLSNFPNINCFDLIYKDSTLFSTAKDGIYQFEAKDRFLSEISVIPIGEQSVKKFN